MSQLESVTIQPNPANTGGKCLIRVAILTWDYLNKNYTWNALAGMTWEDLKSQWQKE